MPGRVTFVDDEERNAPRSRSASASSMQQPLIGSGTFPIRYSIDFDEQMMIQAEERLRHKKASLSGVHGNHGPFIKEAMDKYESLTFKVYDNGPLRQLYIKYTKLGHAQRLAAKWSIYLIIGIIIGLLALALRRTIEHLYEFKISSTDAYLQSGQNFRAFFVYWGINVLYVTISVGAVIFGGPLAAGSGIPEVKGYLNGVRIPGLINLKTFIGKFVSILFSFSSCLALGPEGPMIHIGAAVGAGLSAAKSRTLRIRLPKIFERLRGDREQRDFISSGAAAGVAAAFGAPVGGVLFAIEETSTFWSRELTWRTLFGCLTATMMVNIVGKSGITVTVGNGLINFGISRQSLYREPEIVVFAILGAMGGLLGAFFVKLNAHLNLFRRNYLSKQPNWVKFAEVILITTICALITFSVPLFFPCEPTSNVILSDTICDNSNIVDNRTLISYHTYCDEDSFNQMAVLFIIPPEESAKLLFSRATRLFDYVPLCLHLVLYFTMAVITSGTYVAAGLFVPMMLIGGSMGRIVGKIVAAIFDPMLQPQFPIDPSIYALVGAAAMMSGFSRITISLCVIIIELTQNTQYLLPILVAVLTAKLVGDALSRPIYEELASIKSIPILELHPPSFAFRVGVTEVMAKPVQCIYEKDTLNNIIRVLKTTNHNGFPVVSNEGVGREKTFRGIILRKQLLILLDRQQYSQKEDEAVMLDFEYYLSLMNHKWELESISLPPKEIRGTLYMDIHDYMDRSQVVVQKSFSFIEAYRLFQTQGLRHLPVVDDLFQVVGILTRHDLLYFHFFDERQSVIQPEFFDA
eukprot:TRINITY_DN6623_c0_g1_i1.p1 TRINITY_DN6623_c0_g1~~TRINITY_DN6623_c0_g1_i1.p1  ORF type:complete len:804 (-),score=233.35 TRINITY_DN6623_c0_g1_i1:12-2423(-)